MFLLMIIGLAISVIAVIVYFITGGSSLIPSLLLIAN